MQLQIIFTAADMQQVTHKVSGIKAWEEQRRLRPLALASHTPYDPVSLENTYFNWRAVLKRQPLISTEVIGRGITAFKFRLLPSAWGQNFATINSGERHVFQVGRVDGSSALLHVHRK